MPASYDLALLTNDPTQAGTLTSELTGGGYARINVPNNNANWEAASAGAGPQNRRRTRNVLALEFGVSTGAQGTANYVAGVSGGVMYWYEPIGPFPITAAGQQVRFAAGQLERYHEDP